MGQADRIREGLSGAAAVPVSRDCPGRLRRGADLSGGRYPRPCGTHGRVRTVCDGQCRCSAGAHGDGGSSGYTCSNTDSAADTRSGGNSRGNAATHCAADLDSLAHRDAPAHRNCYAGTNSDSNARTGTHQHADSGTDGDSDHHARSNSHTSRDADAHNCANRGAQPHAHAVGASVGGGVLAVAG